MTPDPKTLATFQRFCDPGATRYDLSEPFIQSGRLFATNGHIAISTPCDEPETQSKPTMSHVMDYETATTKQWKHIETKCDTCNSTGYVTTDGVCDECKGSGDCDECGGSGRVDCCECGQEADCDECDGTGDCPGCSGTGSVDPEQIECKQCNDSRINVDGCCLRPSVVNLINLLSSVRYVITSDNSSVFNKIVFDADGDIRGVALGKKETQ
jgi:hypothetical protein